ncbi:MAG: hypothetical protein IKV67_10160 [Paludibacteraceae bacterium]|nr:hypothetical protein [Paludibacteraceae bacterium]
MYGSIIKEMIVRCVLDCLSCTILKDSERIAHKKTSKHTAIYHEQYFEFVKVCDYDDKQKLYVWNGSAVLFSYLCWYVTAICEYNGIRMYKGAGKGKFLDYNTFLHYVKNVDIDRKAIAEFKGGGKAPKNADAIKDAIIEVLNEILKDVKQLPDE